MLGDRGGKRLGEIAEEGERLEEGDGIMLRDRDGIES